MAKVLKFWHQWSWVYHICWSVMVATAFFVTYENATASNAISIAVLQKEHGDENMKARMMVQEETTQQINSRLSSIEVLLGKVSDRVNQISDRR